MTEIDREKVINDLQDAVNDDWMWQHADYYAKAMENAITLLKEPKAKKGHWIVLEFCANEGIYCSECHMKIFDRTTKPKKKLSQYCPHCGSRNDQFFRDGEVVFSANR